MIYSIGVLASCDISTRLIGAVFNYFMIAGNQRDPNFFHFSKCSIQICYRISYVCHESKNSQVSATYLLCPGARGFLIDHPNCNRKLKLS